MCVLQCEEGQIATCLVTVSSGRGLLGCHGGAGGREGGGQYPGAGGVAGLLRQVCRQPEHPRTDRGTPGELGVKKKPLSG